MRYRYRTDEELKDSGVEWIGKIPKDYKLEPLKKYFMFEKGRNAGIYTAEYVGKNEGKYPVYSGQTENEGIMGLIDSYEYDLKQCLFTTTVGAKVMTVLYLTGKFTLSQNCLIMINNMNNVCTKYAYYYLQELFRYEKSLIPLYMQPSLRIEDLKRYKILIQNLREQEKIANFLDKKTSQFDSIISKKEKLIEKLEEAKKSLVSEVVTGKVKVVKTDDGYELVKRKSDEMKDSGVEWLGDIPKDWEVKKLKYLLSKIGSGKTPKGGADVYQDKGVVFMRSQNVHNTGLILDDVVYISNKIDEEMKNSRVQRQDILLNITGASIGRTSIFEFDNLKANVNQHVCILRPKPTVILPTLLNKIIQSDYIQEQIQFMQTGSSREGLNFEQIGNMILFINEDIDVQKNIDIFLYEKLRNINLLVSKVKTQIEKLKEAKQSLISEAVTGKIEILDY